MRPHTQYALEKTMKNKTAIIALDGADYDYFREWLRNGWLPNLATLLDEQNVFPLKSSDPPVTSVAWASFMTGKNPGEHGVFDFEKNIADWGVKREVVLYDDIDGKMVWDVLGEQEQTCCVLFFPFTYPPKIKNGIMVSGFPMAGESSSNDILSPLEKYVLQDEGEVIVPREKLDKYVARLISKMATKFDLAYRLVRSQKWDYFFFHLQEFDFIQHALLNFIDRDGSELVLMRQFLDVVDQKLAQLIDLLAPEKILFLSDHGFTPCSHAINLNNFLLEREYITLRKNAMTTLAKKLFNYGLTCEWLYQLLPSRFKQYFLAINRDNQRPNQVQRMSLFSNFLLHWQHINWLLTKAVAITRSGIGQIYINPHLTTTEYNTVRAALLADIKNLKVQEESVFDQIYFKEEIYHGKYLAQAPDITAYPRDFKGQVFASPDAPFFSNRIVGSNILFPHRATHRPTGIISFLDTLNINSITLPRSIDQVKDFILRHGGL